MDRSSYGATAEMIGRITDPAQLTAMMRNPQYAGFTNVIVARLQEINHMRQAAQGAAPQPPTVAQQALQNAQQSMQPQQAMARGGIIAFKGGGKVKNLEQYTYQQSEYVPETPHSVSKELRMPPPPVGPALIRDAVRGGDAPPTAYSPYYDASSAADEPVQQKARGGIVAFKDGGKIKRFAKGGDTDNTRDPYAEGWKSIGGGAKKLGAAALDIGQLPAVALRRAYNVGVGLPNALGADLPYVDPGSATPYYDRYVRGAQAATSPTYGVDAMSGAAPTVLPPGAQPSAAPATPEPLPPVSQQDLGLPSMGGGISSLLASSGGARPDRKLSDYTDEMSQVLGPNKDLAEARANIAAQKANALNNALMYAGLGMARSASTTPQQGILGNLAAGATEGLTSFDKQEQERQQMLRDLGRQERSERMGILSAGVNERGQDVRADRQMQLQRMGLGLQAQALKAPALLEQAIRQRAVDLANADRAQGVQRPLSDYHLQAWQEYNSQLGVAGMRADTQRAAQRAAYITKMQQMNPSLSAQYLGQQFDAGVAGAGGGATGTNYGSLE